MGYIPVGIYPPFWHDSVAETGSDEDLLLRLSSSPHCEPPYFCDRICQVLG